MGIFNALLRAALSGGGYWCSQCGEKMKFEDEYEDTLICPQCGHSIDIDRYGCEDDEECDALYPTKEEVCGEDEDDDSDEDDEDNVPEGCRACGGPYPQCMTSCKLFDD